MILTFKLKKYLQFDLQLDERNILQVTVKEVG